MPFQALFSWWNAIYTLPLAFVLVFLAITSVVSLVGGAFGALSHGEAQSEADHDVDAHADVHHDVDAHADVHHDVDAHADVHHDAGLDADADASVDLHHDAGVDSDADVDADSEIAAPGHGGEGGHGGHDHDHGALMSALLFLGAGRAPLVLVVEILLLLWGLIGMSLHQAFAVAAPGALLWSLPITLLFSVLGTRSFAAAFGRFFKASETAALRRDQIVGRTGRVVYAVTDEAGTVHVRDQHGTLHRLRARSEHGRLESGQEIVVLGYDPKGQVYRVDDATAFVDRP